MSKRIPLPDAVATIYAAVEELEARYRGRKFTPDGHLVGSLGEVVAAEALGLELLPMSNPAHDARDQDGRFVQVKLTAGNRVSMYADSERLIVLRVVNKSEAEVVYDGPGSPVWEAAGPIQKNGQRCISVASLRRMQAAIDATHTRPSAPDSF